MQRCRGYARRIAPDPVSVFGSQRIAMAQRTAKLGQGSIFLRNDWWWCDHTAGGVRRRESCKTKDREEALAYLQRRQGKLASGEFLAPDRIMVKDPLMLLLEDYDVRGVAQAYIAGLKVNRSSDRNLAISERPS
jgi:hypothetical protein